MISVIIPSYNRQKTIVSSVNSVLNQTIQDIEIIVVDDGSTDETLLMLEKINDRRIRVIHQNHEGACAARNRGIEAAQGEYIAFHDSDDICRENRLEIELNCLKDNGADLVCGNVMTHLGRKEFVSPGRVNGWLKTCDDMFNITTMTFFGKKTLFQQFQFDPLMPRWQDLDLLLSMCGKANVFFCEQILCDYFRDGDSMSLSPEKCLAAYELIMKKYPEISKNGGLLFSRLTKMYADSKVVLNRKDYFKDYKDTYRNNRSIVNFIWLIFARIGCAKILYRVIH